jgi:hypothetical protein
VTHDGEVRHEPTRELLTGEAADDATAEQSSVDQATAAAEGTQA